MVTPPSDTLKLAFRTPNTVEARALTMELNAAGVNVQITGDYSDTAYPGLAIGGMANKELWIAESDWPEAGPIVSQWVQTHHPRDLEMRPAKLQFSLRAILVVMTLIAIGAALGQSGGPDAVALALSSSIPLSIFALIAYSVWSRLRLRRPDDVDDSDD
jgi:hypothetical protein